MYATRYTRKNPIADPKAAVTYRIPFVTNDMWQEGISIGEKYILGEIVDKLGKYEDLGEPEEIKKRLERRA